MKFIKGTHYKKAIIVILFLVTSNLANTQNSGIVEVDSNMFASMKWLMVCLLGVIVFLVVIARQISGFKAAVSVAGIKPIPETGRSISEGYKEFVSIISLGIVGIATAYVIGLKPVPASALAGPADDPNKELTTEEMIVSKDVAIIKTGQDKFQTLCIACHGSSLEGNGVGPNLTDDYWIHGGGVADLYKVITNGVPDKGMMPWKGAVKPKERIAVISYIKSLAGSNPPNAKAPQGNLWQEGMQDSVKQDSAMVDSFTTGKKK